jgi:hypothetical protein
MFLSQNSEQVQNGIGQRECLGFNNSCYQSFQSAVNRAKHKTWYETRESEVTSEFHISSEA